MSRIRRLTCLVIEGFRAGFWCMAAALRYKLVEEIEFSAILLLFYIFYYKNTLKVNIHRLPS